MNLRKPKINKKAEHRVVVSDKNGRMHVLDNFYKKGHRHGWFYESAFLKKIGVLVEAFEGTDGELMQQLEGLNEVCYQAKNKVERAKIIFYLERAVLGVLNGGYKKDWFIKSNFLKYRYERDVIWERVLAMKSCWWDENTSSGDKTAHERTTSELEASCEEAGDVNCEYF